MPKKTEPGNGRTITIHWWNIGKKQLDYSGPIIGYLKKKGITWRENHTENGTLRTFYISTSSSAILYKTTDQFDDAAENAIALFLTEMGDRALLQGRKEHRLNWS